MDATPRERIVYTAVQHLRERGVHGTGLRPLVADARAPWGSLRHYFPGGKDQVLAEALHWAGAYGGSVVTDYLESARRPSPTGLLRAVLTWWITDLQEHDFARGCPLAATIADAQADPALRRAAAQALLAWRTPLREGLVVLGKSPRDADELSTLLLAALEGGLVLARVQDSVEPLRVVERRLRPLFRD